MTTTLQPRPGKPGTVICGTRAVALFQSLKRDHGFNTEESGNGGFKAVGRDHRLLLASVSSPIDKTSQARVSLEFFGPYASDWSEVQALANGGPGLGVVEARLHSTLSSPFRLLCLVHEGKQSCNSSNGDYPYYHVVHLDLTGMLGRLATEDASISVAAEVAGILSKLNEVGRRISGDAHIREAFAKLRHAQELTAFEPRDDGLDGEVERIRKGDSEIYLSRARKILHGVGIVADAAGYIADSAE